MDYLDNDVLTDGLEDKDSTFYTKNGRIVKRHSFPLNADLS